VFSFSPKFLSTYRNQLTYSAHECPSVNLQEAQFGIRICENNKTRIQVSLFQIIGIHFPVYIKITRCILRWKLELLMLFSGLSYAYLVLHFLDEGLVVLKRMGWLERCIYRPRQLCSCEEFFILTERSWKSPLCT